MYSKPGTIVAIIMAIFPFAAVIINLARSESALTAIVVLAIVLVFFMTLLIASRITIEPEQEAASAAQRAPAPPIEWSWDGTNRRPDADASEGTAPKSEAKH